MVQNVTAITRAMIENRKAAPSATRSAAFQVGHAKLWIGRATFLSAPNAGQSRRAIGAPSPSHTRARQSARIANQGAPAAFKKRKSSGSELRPHSGSHFFPRTLIRAVAVQIQHTEDARSTPEGLASRALDGIGEG
jgi:hypothetical protein